MAECWGHPLGRRGGRKHLQENFIISCRNYQSGWKHLTEPRFKYCEYGKGFKALELSLLFSKDLCCDNRHSLLQQLPGNSDFHISTFAALIWVLSGISLNVFCFYFNGLLLALQMGRRAGKTKFLHHD